MIGANLGFDFSKLPLISSGSIIPDRLVVKPIDPWPGDAAAGMAICDESHDIRSGTLQVWPERLHRFFWLRDLRTMGGKEARQCAKDMVMQWIAHYGGRPKTQEQQLAWRTDILGERISNWIAHYDFIDSCNAQHDETFHDAFFTSLYTQTQQLARRIPGGLYDLDLLKTLKGLLYAGLAFEGQEALIEKSLALLKPEVEKQFLADGMHISRSPMQLMRGLQILLDVKSALNIGGYPLPFFIQHTIDRSGPALKFFRLGDKRLATFHGTQKGCPALVDSILAQAGVRGKAHTSLSCAGFERLNLGRSVLMFDCGSPPKAPYDRLSHASPLSFEMAYGKDRVFVSCGTHPTQTDWSDSLRATAAHNAVCLDHRNAYDIRDNGHFARKAQSVHYKRTGTERDGSILLEGQHDGYLPLNGVMHSRSLYLGEKGHDLRGEDKLCAKITPLKPIDIAIRFHLHPRVLVSLVQDGTHALIRLPSGIGWRFQNSAGLLTLEDSIYLGEGCEPRKTKQLVIFGQTSKKQSLIKWSFQREGL